VTAACTTPSGAVVIPLRAFRLGKARLAGALDPDARAELARRMAERVIAAAGPLPVAVVTSDPEVAAWAATAGAEILADPGTLDRAAAAGLDWAGALGVRRVVIAHADLPRAPAGSLTALMRDGSRPIATLVPCHRDDGTPVLSLPTGVPFTFAYGPGSFRAHVREARTGGLGIRVVRDPDLGFDVDVAADLEALDAAPCGSPA
jgi:2-phospho-L-lactate guanylyltransferase